MYVRKSAICFLLGGDGKHRLVRCRAVYCSIGNQLLSLYLSAQRFSDVREARRPWSCWTSYHGSVTRTMVAASTWHYLVNFSHVAFNYSNVFAARITSEIFGVAVVSEISIHESGPQWSVLELMLTPYLRAEKYSTAAKTCRVRESER